MILNIIFIISLLGIVTLIISKILEEKSKGKPLFLRLVSLGDERVRNATVEFAHMYSDWRERGHFFLNNQLPLHTKNLMNKFSLMIKDKFEKHVGDIRGSKFLKKSDGLSEYLKSISEK
ncbi:MAG TPA: hypothetical protein PLD99_02175, partial [Parcubacteria group bacterium]|nr:hypothetical protein [Parcubacteria group bacterium]